MKTVHSLASPKDIADAVENVHEAYDERDRDVMTRYRENVALGVDEEQAMAAAKLFSTAFKLFVGPNAVSE